MPRGQKYRLRRKTAKVATKDAELEAVGLLMFVKSVYLAVITIFIANYMYDHEYH